MPLVFIILVNWNGRQVTLECLASLTEIAYKKCKVIVVDNASDDGSVDAIQARFPSTIILAQKENLRFGGGNNIGIRYALEQGAELICLLNNDTTVDKDFLTHLVHCIQSDKKCGMVAPKVYYHDEPNRIWFAGSEISMWTGTMRHVGIREVDHGQRDASREIDYATGCCLLARKEVIEKVGMLDETFFMYTEDADWSMRARRVGYSIMFEPKSRVWHKLSVASGGHLSFFKMKNKFISNFRFFFRYASLPQKLVFPWMSVLVNGWAAIKYFFAAGR
jgi:GT2 family glycosyltransferase